jgi:hypothetical protein
VGLAASSTNGTTVFTFDNFAFYSSPIVTFNNLPSGGSWSILKNNGTQISVSGVSCWTASTVNLSTYTSMVPIDYNNGGGSIALWTGNNTCSGSPTLTYQPSGYDGIFGGDVYSYGTTSTVTLTGATTPQGTSTITVSPAGSVSF